MVAAATKHGLPLIELRKPTPFVRITEAVHALIVDAQLAELRATEEIHQRFTELSVEGAEAAEVVAQAAALAGAPVVLENLSRQVLAYDTAGERPGAAAGRLGGGTRGGSHPNGRTAYDADAGWLVTMVGARGQDWGRLLLRWAPAAATPCRRAADPADDPARTGRVHAGTGPADPARRRRAGAADAPYAADRAARPHRPVDEVALRARALGVPLERRHLVGVVVRTAGRRWDAGRLRPEDAQAHGCVTCRGGLRGAARGRAWPAWPARLDDHTVGALIALREADDEETALTRSSPRCDGRIPAQGADSNGHGPAT